MSPLTRRDFLGVMTSYRVEEVLDEVNRVGDRNSKLIGKLRRTLEELTVDGKKTATPDSSADGR